MCTERLVKHRFRETFIMLASFVVPEMQRLLNLYVSHRPFPGSWIVWCILHRLLPLHNLLRLLLSDQLGPCRGGYLLRAGGPLSSGREGRSPVQCSVLKFKFTSSRFIMASI